MLTFFPLKAEVSNSIYLEATVAKVWVRLGCIRFSKTNAFIRNRKKYIYCIFNTFASAIPYTRGAQPVDCGLIPRRPRGVLGKKKKVFFFF